NVRAAYLLAQTLAPGMIARGWGRVVNVSSQSALVALPDHLAYCASKGALEMMSKVMALEWAPKGLTVNCIAPTVINTPMAAMAFPSEEDKARMLAQIPVGRFGEVEEVARLACFLASQDAAMITGDTIRLDGGWTLR
nr:SDR family oxidoreductase [Deinococcota bacterium]